MENIIYQPVMQKGVKFQRRKDLTLEVRLWIAFVALMSQKWGIITQLATKYGISRTFVYILQEQLGKASENCFSVYPSPSKIQLVEGEKTKSLELAILLRLEGKCSIPAISEILKEMGLKNNSVGTISTKLQNIGRYLPGTYDFREDAIKYVYLAADEIFSHSTPILISVDPISSAILRIELAESRKTGDWEEHFNNLKENGANVVFLTSDEAQGICLASTQAFPDVSRQPDTFHAISHRLGKWVNSLEKSAYSAIEKEYHCLETFDSAKSGKVLQKRMDAYFVAVDNTNKAIELYETYKFLYRCIISNLQVFDGEGNPRSRKDSEEEIRIALDYMICLPVNKIKKDINTIYNLLDDLLEYLDVASRATKKLYARDIPKKTIQVLALAWQHNRNAIKAKNAPRREHLTTKEKAQVEIARMMSYERFEALKETVFSEFDKIVQSSAMVENINSILRNYLNTSRNRINQELLNLIMFYHNHRRYKAGKRKGKTPVEILTGKKQDKEWLEILMDKLKQDKIFSQVA